MKSITFFICMNIFLGIASITYSTMSEAEPIKLTVSTFFPASSGQAKTLFDWAKTVESRSNGAVQIVYFTEGALLEGDKTYEGVLHGTVDIGFSLFAYTQNRFPVMEVVDLPMGYPTGKVATRVAHKFVKTFQPKELQNVKVLFIHANGPSMLHTKKPVRTIKDIKGMKIRVQGLSAKVVEALGGVPVVIGQEDAYEALHKGIVEGTFSPMEVLKTWKQAEVIRYTTKCYSVGSTTSFFIVMNKDKWNSLPAVIKKIFNDVSESYVSIFGDLWDVLDREGENHSLRLGNQMINLSNPENERWYEAVEPVINSYIQKTPNGADYVSMIRKLINSCL